jgi:hypothetical protein
MVTRPVGQVPPTIGRMPFDAAFPDRPVEFSMISISMIASHSTRWPISPIGCRVNRWSVTLPVSHCWLLTEDPPGEPWINRATSYAT